MATEKMTALTLSGPIEKLDDAIRNFVVDRDFHPENAITFLAGMRRLKPVESQADVYSQLLGKADALLAKLGLKPAAAECPDGYTAENTDAFLQSLTDELTALDTVEESAVEDFEALESPLLHVLQNVPVSVKDLQDLHYVHCRVGSIPQQQWPEFEQMTIDRDDLFAAEILREDGRVYILAMAVPDSADRLDANLSRVNFVRLKPTKEDVPDETAAQILSRVAAEQEAAKQKTQEEEAARAKLLDERKPELLSRRAWLAYQNVCQTARGYAGYSFGRFYLAGWVPASTADAYQREFEKNPGFSCVQAADDEVHGAKPPVRMKNRGVGSIMTPLMKMYGMPAYGTLDPRIFMVITYVLFFGMMFGDAGQGACIALLGFLLYKKNGGWLWRVLGVCGCSAVVFGLIYGSVFGLEDLLPWGGYHPLDSDHIMIVLLAGAAVGVVVILGCMLFNIVNCVRDGNIKGAFFSANGLSGLVFYVSLLAMIVGAYTGMVNLMTAWFILIFVVLPLLLIWFGDPIAKLLQHDPNWKPESVGMFIVEGFFDIFESLISYMSNTMSFLRVGAFAISHAGMMMVVSMLCANMSATGNILVMVIGNIFVAALEAALSSIQIIRLEFYEIFGRFYVGGGQEFHPLSVDYSK